MKICTGLSGEVVSFLFSLPNKRNKGNKKKQKKQKKQKNQN